MKAAPTPNAREAAGIVKARVYVTLKPGVLDPQGKAVRGGLAALGYAGVRDVRVGKYIEVALEDGPREELEAQLQEMCRRLLANPVIEEYRIDLDARPGSAGA